MSKILITGSSGYIGQHLAKLLQNKGHILYGLDIVKNLTNIDHFYHTDIRNQFLPTDLFDVVIHLAALVNVGDSVNRPIEYYDTNLFGTKNVLEKINFKNFIFASTGAAEKCESPYGTSKRAAEDVVKNYCEGSPHTVFRFYNVIGSDGIKPTNPDGLFFNLIKATETGNFTIYGTDYNTIDGTCIRDYVHVNEICLALEAAITQSSDNIENLGHGKGNSVKQIVKIFQEVNDININVNVGPRRAGDIETSVLSNVSSYMQEVYSLADLLKLHS
jgi:UDP-glucose 4-epimerase